jgi:hypothetical protein
MAISATVRTSASEVQAASLQRRYVGWSAFIGTAIEYYDFTLYGLLGVAVFDKLFFPKTDPMPWASSAGPWAASFSRTMAIASGASR